MEKEKKVSAFFIELDALLDTRLGTIATYSDAIFESIVKNNYHLRLIDGFPSLPFEEFQSAYAARNKSILSRSVVTPMGVFMENFCRETARNTINSPFHFKPKVILNVYPYVLTSAEENVFISIVHAVTKGIADIQLVNMSPGMISPDYLKDEVSMIAVYNCYTWLEAQSLNNNLVKQSCPEVSMVSAALYFKRPVEVPKDIVKVFKDIELSVAPFIGLSLIPVESFSAVLKKTA